MKRNKRVQRVLVSADGAGVVSHAGVGLLREMAEYTGLVDGVTAALADTYRGPWLHAPGRVFTDLAVAVADGADAISGISVLGDREDLFGPVASMPTTWRVLDRIDADHLDAVREGRSAARALAWAAGAGPDLTQELCLDFDATITIAHSEKENAAATWKKTFGFHPLLCFLDRPDVAGGEALAGLLRKGNAGSNTVVDHIAVLRAALTQLPGGHTRGKKVLVRVDGAGGTHELLAWLTRRRLSYSVGFSLPGDLTSIQAKLATIPNDLWEPAYDADGQLRPGAWVAEVTDLFNLASWPTGMRLIVRKERPHPGAQLRITDVDGMRITAFVTNPTRGQLADLELRLVRILLPVLAGLTVGLLQWLALRPYLIHPADWLLQGGFGWALAFALGLWVIDAIGGSPLGTLVGYLLFGLIIGALQWPVLRREIPNALPWIIASMVGWALGGYLGQAVLTLVAGGGEVSQVVSSAVVAAVTGLVAGAITGLALVWIVRQPDRALARGV